MTIKLPRKLHHPISNRSELFEQKYLNILHFGFIISLIQQKKYIKAFVFVGGTKLPRGPHAALGPRPAGWKALPYTFVHLCMSSHYVNREKYHLLIFYMVQIMHVLDLVGI